MSSQDSGEKTEKASKKKKEKAREEGQVVKSREIGTALSIVTLTGFLYIAWDRFLADLSAVLGNDLSADRVVSGSVSVDANTVMRAYAQSLLDGLRILWPVLVIALLCGILADVLQTGFVFSTKALAPKFSRINPIEGFKRIFSGRTMAEFVKAMLKVVFLCYFTYSEYLGAMKGFPALMNEGVGDAFSGFMKIALRIALKMGGVLAAIAGVDYLYQRWRYEKDLMMTKQEVREEYKQMEGDPQIKSAIRRRQRQVSRMRMMRQVQEADVVITNPTHYAVAIRYRENEDGAPLVLAKGTDFLAQKIKEKAKECKIEIVENRPVARALYRSCEIGDEIPRELYQAVAEILAYVYRMKNRVRSGSR